MKAQYEVTGVIEEIPSPELAKREVESFVENTPIVNGLRCNHEFICGNAIGVTTFGETPKVAWVYLHTFTQRVLFIPIYRNHSIYLGFTDGTLQAAKC